MRQAVVAGNWKMNLDRERALALAEGLRAADGVGAEMGVAPPSPYLAAVAAALDGSGIWVAGQDLHAAESGAYTGDVSGAMLRDIGCTHVLVGHSERRHGHGESPEAVGAKVRAALRSGLRPILCVGETLDERDGERTEAVVFGQLDAGLSELDEGDLAGLIVAYEPVWAIGTGRNATPEQAGEVHRAIRGWLATRFSAGFADQTRIQYGGSVKASNAAELLAVPDIDGALVGGASLEADSFLAIARAG